MSARGADGHAGGLGCSVLAVALALAVIGCAGARPENLGLSDAGRLAPCPASPNCVSSDATDEEHGIAPLALGPEVEARWAEVVAAVSALPGAEIREERDGYLHAECRSRLFGFVDDLELHARPEEGIVSVRSASRVGHGDMGVNRARVETLRERLGGATPTRDRAPDAEGFSPR